MKMFRIHLITLTPTLSLTAEGVLRHAVTGILIFSIAGCVVVPSRAPEVAPPAPPANPPRIEHTFGDFRFAVGSGDLEPSSLAARVLNDEIMCAWERRGFVSEETSVEPDEFSGKADYTLTLSGSQRNETSFWAQLLNALTVLVVPYSVTQQYDLQYELTAVRSGQRWTATVRDADRTYIGLLVAAGLPVMNRGHREVVERMADELYAQFDAQGAFASP
jgi:hypothetical protein